MRPELQKKIDGAIKLLRSASEVAYAIIHGVCSAIDLACIPTIAYIIKNELK